MMKKLESIRQVYEFVQKAKAAQRKLASYTQQEIDTIVAAVAEAGRNAADHLARMAAGETGMGRVESKIAKNRFAVENVYRSIRDMKTTGIVRHDTETGCYEIAQPVGVIAAIIPTTNPTSTTLFKALVGLKARNCVVFAPHPRAVRCISHATEVAYKAAVAAGAPQDCLQCITEISLEATQELMKHPDVDFILATGGPGLVKAAYASGKPAVGVGQGNSPAYIDRSADVHHAVHCIVESQLFDFGTICSSEQSVVVDAPIEKQVVQEFQKQRGYFLAPQEIEMISKLAFKDGRMNAAIVGQPAYRIAEMAGIRVPADTSVLLAPLQGVGPDYPLSRETLCPILAFYSVRGWQEGCRRCMELLSFEGMGHTLAVHATAPEVIMEFGLQKPVSRILVNAPTAQGGVGFATDLMPSLTLGCGAFGGNITSDNVSAQHLFNLKRVAAIRPNFPLWDQDKAIAEDLCRLQLREEYGKAAKHGVEMRKPTAFSTTQQPTAFSTTPTAFTTAQRPLNSPAAWQIRDYSPPSSQHRRTNWP